MEGIMSYQSMVDIRKEQCATLRRKKYPYSMMARFFIWLMDSIAGKRTSLSKLKLLELLASIPYREWEKRLYANMTKNYSDHFFVRKCNRMIQWCRQSQDNEFWHLQVLEEKMKEDKEKDAWYLSYWVRVWMVCCYVAFSKYTSRINLPWALFFNAQFEDHAEHCYAKLIEEHPSWDYQTVHSSLVNASGPYESWGDVFRRICLDERDHRNIGFYFGGRIEYVEEYTGMPDLNKYSKSPG
jgi:hypothetical protein